MVDPTLCSMWPARVVNADQALQRYGSLAQSLFDALSEGDPLADAAIAALDDPRWIEHGCAGDSLGDAPPAVAALFEHAREVPDWVEPNRIERAGALFFRSGMAGGITLGAKSLIAGYCAPAGNKPLVFSGQLESQLPRRLAETGRFVVATNTRGALWPGGDGWGITLRVRLMHAKVRALIARSARWNSEWGLPINQHDMVATSLLFSIVFLDGIRAFGFPVTAQEAEDYIHLWRYSGWLMGVRDDLLPKSEPEARRMMSLIELTQGPPDEDARALARALLESPRRTMPNPRQAEFHVSLGTGMCRALLGDELADGLGLNRNAWRFVVPTVRLARRVLPSLPPKLQEAMGKRYWKRNVETGLAGAPAAFQLPARLLRTQL